MQPPRAPQVKHVHEQHGDIREDYFHWLKDRDKQEVLDYLKAENAYTEHMLKPVTPLKDEIYQETIARIQETDTDAPWPYLDYDYYFRTEKGEEHEIFCRRKKGSDAEEIIFNENEHAKGCDYFDIGCYELSVDGRWMALSVDTKGDEKYQLWLIDMQDYSLHKTKLKDIAGSLVFSTHPYELWYCRLDDAHRPFQVWCHDITGQAQDTLCYQEDDERFWLGFYRSQSDEYLMVQSGSKLTSEVRYVEASKPRDTLTCFLPRESEHEYDIDHHGDYFYIRSNRDAKNFALWRCPVNNTDEKPWEIVIPHNINVCIEGFVPFQSFLMIQQREEGLSQLKVMLDSGESHIIEMPEVVYSVGLGQNWEYDTDTIRYVYHSLTTPASIYAYNVKTKESTLLKQDAVLGDYKPEDYVAERLHAKAPDGTDIPISLVYKKSLLSLPMPMFLTGYGAYGIDMDPWFSYSRISLLNRGFVFAIAHIRGGGDMGELWHDAGKLMLKKNSFSDFITCSEYLIEKAYTSPDKLFISGGSAGGLLMGAVVNEAPQLFRGAIAHVPFVDALNTMLDETLPLTIVEYEEWGNPNEKAAYDYIKSYSPYDNVREQHYPALFITAGLHDPRVAFWEPAKWTAKLRLHQLADNPILLKTQMTAGHAGQSGRYNAIKEVAEEFSFVLGLMDGEVNL